MAKVPAFAKPSPAAGRSSTGMSRTTTAAESDFIRQRDVLLQQPARKTQKALTKTRCGVRFDGALAIDCGRLATHLGMTPFDVTVPGRALEPHSTMRSPPRPRPGRESAAAASSRNFVRSTANTALDWRIAEVKVPVAINLVVPVLPILARRRLPPVTTIQETPFAL